MRVFSKKNIAIFGPTLVTVAILSLYLITPLAFAQTGGTGIGAPSGGTGINQPSGGTGGSYTLQNPLGVDSLCKLIGVLLKAAIVIGIPIAVLFIVYAGFKFIMARGSPAELSEARSNLLNVIIGIAIFLGASLIAQVIISTLHQLGVSGVNSC